MTYHRVKRARELICPECVDEERANEKTCYFCGKKYSDEHGMIRSQEDQGAALKAAFGKKEEVSEEAVQKKLEELTKRGVTILPNPE